MTGFFLALLAALLAGLGARDQVMLAELSRSQGIRPAALCVAIATCAGACAFAAWASQAVAPMLNANARLFLAGLALAFAGAEALVLGAARAPREPTRSLGALAIVLAAQQLTDATRFLVFAISLAAYTPGLAAGGATAAGAILLGWAWAAPDLLAAREVRLARRIIGAVLLVAGLGLSFSVLDLNR